MGSPSTGPLLQRARTSNGWWVGLLPIVTAILAACGPDDPTPVATRSRDALLPACEASSGIVVDTVATGLAVPWSAAFLPDGRALVSERTGAIRLVDPVMGLVDEPWATVDVFDSGPSGGEVGLMGMDVRQVDGGFEVYVAYAVVEASPGAVGRVVGGLARRLRRLVDREAGHVVTLQVDRLVRTEESLRSEVVIDDIPGGLLHGGGALRFGPDGYLYLATGDAATPPSAQWEGTYRGRILRFTADGEPAPGNPFAGSMEFARGIRSGQGLAWESTTGALLAIDHGPSGMPAEDGRAGNDELNLVRPGDNLGWPWLAGLGEGEGLTPPLSEWSPAIAPAGMTVYTGPEAEWQGDVFVTSLTTGSVRRVELADGGTAARCESVHSLGLGRLRLVADAPDGSLWVGTSNRDGRGSPRGDDDVIVRIRPERSPAVVP